MKHASIRSVIIEKALKLINIPEASDPAVFEKKMQESMQGYTLPDKVRDKYGFTEFVGYTDTFSFTADDQAGRRTIFYLHGGAYWSNPLILHFMFFKKLARHFQARIVLPVYPKAPAHHVDEVHDMILERYVYMIEKEHLNPKDIILMGESAGGGLALAFLELLKEKNLPMPSCAFLHSPWLDVSMTNEAMKDIQKDDPLLSIEDLAIKGREYAGMYDVKDWRVSPVYGDMTGLPPVFVDCGTHEIFYADVLKMEDIAERQDLNMVFRFYKNQIHCFVGLPVPEANDLLEKMKQDLSAIDLKLS